MLLRGNAAGKRSRLVFENFISCPPFPARGASHRLVAVGLAVFCRRRQQRSSSSADGLRGYNMVEKLAAVLDVEPSTLSDRVCDRLVERRFALRTAFDALNENQSPPYCEFHDWKKVGPSVGEAVRQALIDCRVSEHLIFRSVLKNRPQAADGGTAGRCLILGVAPFLGWSSTRWIAPSFRKGHKNIQHTVRYTELSPTRFKNFWRE
jgi:hypothetical protein